MKTWLITGVSSGFGKEMTRQLLEKGETVIGTVRQKEKVSELIGHLQTNLLQRTIGYSRTLNAINCLNEVVPENK